MMNGFRFGRYLNYLRSIFKVVPTPRRERKQRRLSLEQLEYRVTPTTGLTFVIPCGHENTTLRARVVRILPSRLQHASRRRRFELLLPV